MFDSYLLNIPNFKSGDKVIDCGANVGELFLAFENLKLDIDYLGFEPDPNVFECLEINTNKSNYNCALSNRKGEVDFYIDSSGGNSSMHESSATKLKTKVESLISIIKFSPSKSTSKSWDFLSAKLNISSNVFFAKF